MFLQYSVFITIITILNLLRNIDLFNGSQNIGDFNILNIIHPCKSPQYSGLYHSKKYNWTIPVGFFYAVHRLWNKAIAKKHEKKNDRCLSWIRRTGLEQRTHNNH